MARPEGDECYNRRVNLLSRREIERLRRRRDDPAFGAAWQALDAAAQAALDAGHDIPRTGGGWGHDYFCPDHAARLEYDRTQPHAHRCPVDGHVFSGEPFDAAWVSRRHSELGQGLQAAALAWLASGAPRESRYREHVVGVLATYAARYEAYPVHGEHAGKGKVLGQSLDEAVWSIPIAWAYDAVRESLAPTQQAQIERDLLRPLVAHLQTQVMRRIHNIECWTLAGIATVAIVLGDDPGATTADAPALAASRATSGGPDGPEGTRSGESQSAEAAALLAPVFDPDFGLAAQIQEGVREDGWWWEGSPHYHFYTLRSLAALSLALRRRHAARLDLARLQRMLGAPLVLTRANLSQPALNDGWFTVTEPGDLAGYAAVYEVGCAIWQHPEHLAFLARLYRSGTPRDSLEALLIGPEPDLVGMGKTGKGYDSSSTGYGGAAAGQPSRDDATCSARRATSADADRAQAALAGRPALEVQAASGYAIFRAGDGKADQACHLLLKYGPHGGGHGHPDKLALDLHGFGHRLSADLGTPGYGIALNRTWYRQTLAHNTVLLDGQPQAPATGELVQTAMDATTGFMSARARVQWTPGTTSAVPRGAAPLPPLAPTSPYAGATAERCIFWRTDTGASFSIGSFGSVSIAHPTGPAAVGASHGTSAPRYFLDVVRVRCPEPRLIELAWHHAGTLRIEGVTPTEPLAPLPDEAPYALLSGITHHRASGAQWQARWHLDGAEVGTCCWALDPPGAEVVTGRAPANPAAETRSIVLRRARGTEAVFVAVFEVFSGAPRVRAVRWRLPQSAPGEPDTLTVQVETNAGPEVWTISQETMEGRRTAAP